MFFSKFISGLILITHSGFYAKQTYLLLFSPSGDSVFLRSSLPRFVHTDDSVRVRLQLEKAGPHHLHVNSWDDTKR